MAAPRDSERRRPVPADGALVLDANIVIGWCFGRRLPQSSIALLARVRREGAQAPDMLRQEVESVVGRRARGRSLSAERVVWFTTFFADLPIAYDPVGLAEDYAAARALAEETGLTVKDATYLELALRKGAPLATRDRPLREAARRKGAALA